ncbi:MAG: hypothetical protein H6703_12300 [Myxococcales bacterium]|nr:hypothetical protein [Myxococcales bacterium]MCB9543213.1 hypothetical protein [Myxococcales bacterium]MCB9553674.1 hypothetical protein [Myxococcales bacterium]
MRGRLMWGGLCLALVAGCEVEQTPWPESEAGVDGATLDGAARGDRGVADRGAADAGDGAVEADLGSAFDAGGDGAVVDAMTDRDAVIDAMPDGMADAMPDGMADAMVDAMPDAMPEPAVIRWLIVVDESEEENRAGTAGADICGAVAFCEGAEFIGVAAQSIGGDGLVCDGVPSAVCGMTARDDPAAALDDGAVCAGGSSPSDYVSLGIAGELAIDFGRDLRGCSVEVVELLGRETEAFAVFACATPVLLAESCLDGGAALGAQRGGRLVVEL